MRLPSLALLSNRAALTFRRFPATLIVCFLGAIALIIEFERYKSIRYSAELSDYVIFTLTCLLGLPLYFAIELWLEKRSAKMPVRLALYAIAAVLLSLFYFQYSPVESDAWQLFILVIAAHLAVSFIAFLRRDETNDFWLFNKTIFLRILTAVLYSGVLMLGLSLALGALDILFEVDVHEESYAQLACVLAIFNTWFFLAGIPDRLSASGSQLSSAASDDLGSSVLAAESELRTYPKGLKIFTQFVLLPLVTIYLAILYPYAIKLLIEWDLPRGWVSNPVLCFAVLGILSFLLLFPIRNESGNEWIRKFSRYFFIALVPLLALPTLGIYTRVRDYGITEPRYFVIALVLWLLGISIYFIISKRKDIRLIPITLSLVAVLSALGPTSAFSVAERSQFAELGSLLVKNQLVGPNRNIADTIFVQPVDFERIRSISNYFRFEREKGMLEEWLLPQLPAGAVALDSSGKNFKIVGDLSAILNFKTTQDYRGDSYLRFGYSDPATTNLTPISGYDFYVPLTLSQNFRNAANGQVRQSQAVNGPLSISHQEGISIVVSRLDPTDSIKITYTEILLELRARKDSTLRAGGDTEAISMNILRSSRSIDLLIALKEVSAEYDSPHNRRDPEAGERETKSDSLVNFWGNGAIFLKAK